jgi:hypothetical protein
MYVPAPEMTADQVVCDYIPGRLKIVQHKRRG